MYDDLIPSRGPTGMKKGEPRPAFTYRAFRRNEAFMRNTVDLSWSPGLRREQRRAAKKRNGGLLWFGLVAGNRDSAYSYVAPVRE